jgi:hypothetical protein
VGIPVTPRIRGLSCLSDQPGILLQILQKRKEKTMPLGVKYNEKPSIIPGCPGQILHSTQHLEQATPWQQHALQLVILPHCSGTKVLVRMCKVAGHQGGMCSSMSSVQHHNYSGKLVFLQKLRDRFHCDRCHSHWGDVPQLQKEMMTSWRPAAVHSSRYESGFLIQIYPVSDRPHSDQGCPAWREGSDSYSQIKQ